MMNYWYVKSDWMDKLIEKRDKNSHKGDYGRVGVIAGSRGMTGAPYLTSQAALRMGTGLVYTMVPEYIETIMCIKLTEAIVKPIYDGGKGHFTYESISEIMIETIDKDVVAVGPGLGVGEDRVDLVNELIRKCNRPLVIDADGINCIKDREILLESKHPIIMTPHLGEMARFLDISIGELDRDREKYAKKVAEKYNVYLVLKGNKTIVSSPEGKIYINNTGNPGMATAGSGDVLTGIIASLIGQGLKPFNASKLGVYIHGLAGDLAKDKKGEYGMIASDILENISYVMKDIKK